MTLDFRRRSGAGSGAGTLPAMPEAPPTTETPAVRCARLTKRFGATTAVDDVTLAVQQGEILALLGPSGCGKTTFLRLVAGFERADAGDIDLAGRVVVGDDTFVPPERRRVGFVFQDYALFPHLSVSANVGFGVEPSLRATRTADTLGLVGLGGLGDRYPHELSGGEQQRVALARALAPGPAIVLLDEPFSNLDADLRERVRGEVRGILRTAGASTVFVTHDQEEAFDIADRIAVMNRGRIEQLGRPEEIYHTPQTRFVADFVGDADFLPAEVTGDRLVTELGSYPLNGVAVAPGGVEIMLRPEDIELRPTDRADAPLVTARRFKGPLSLSTVRLPTGRVVTGAHSSQQIFSPGQRVEVGFLPDHLVLFRGEDRVAWIPARVKTGTD
jgi:iron(III) transport system ATP-binding protein